MSAELILIVCSANVCRSPLAEFLMRQDLTRPGIRVGSAGTHAHEGQSVCDLVAGYRDTRGWAHDASSHRARLVTSDLLDEAALVLTASQEIRSEIVRLHPEVRDRTHTLREAAHRGARFSPHADDSIVADYSDHLDRARSSIGPMPVVRRFWRPDESADETVSIADRHGGRPGAHRRTMRDVHDATAAIVEQLTRPAK